MHNYRLSMLSKLVDLGIFLKHIELDKPNKLDFFGALIADEEYWQC
jgi:hypothetical protein